MKDRCREGGVRAALCEHLGEVLERAGASGGDDWNRDGARDGSRQPAIEADFRAVAVDRGQQNLAGAAVFGFARPLDRFTVGRHLSAARVDGAPIPVPLRVDGDKDRLAAVALGERRDERRIRQRGRVQTDFVRAGLNGRDSVRFGSDSAADGQRDEQLARDGADRVGECPAPLEGRCNVEDDEFVDAFRVVTPRELGRVPRRPQPFEVDPFDDESVAHVEAGDDAF
jgi:hypothetical protein